MNSQIGDSDKCWKQIVTEGNCEKVVLAQYQKCRYVPAKYQIFLVSQKQQLIFTNCTNAFGPPATVFTALILKSIVLANSSTISTSLPLILFAFMKK